MLVQIWCQIYLSYLNLYKIQNLSTVKPTLDLRVLTFCEPIPQESYRFYRFPFRAISFHFLYEEPMVKILNMAQHIAMGQYILNFPI